jgi:hypothetical protein
MKPEERPGLGRKIVVTDEGIAPSVIDAIDTTLAKQKTKLVWGCCGGILEVPNEQDEPVPEFIVALASGAQCSICSTSSGLKNDD